MENSHGPGRAADHLFRRRCTRALESTAAFTNSPHTGAVTSVKPYPEVSVPSI